MGILADCDLSMFAAYCHNYGKMVEKYIEVTMLGDTSLSDKNVEYEHPRSYLAERYRKAAYSLAREFGLTPSARTGIAVTEKEKTDPIMELMKKLNSK